LSARALAGKLLVLRATIAVEPLANDLVAIANCIAIDAEAFPYPSAPFGLRDRSARMWVARDGDRGRVIGFIAARVRGGGLYIVGIAVSADSRRRGAGRALVRAAVDGARAEGLRAVALHVSVGNRAAVALYASEGFQARRRMRGFYSGAVAHALASPLEEGGRDAWEMVFILP
jgi:ribosomal protein S18 acetylase RimI-like enzyme